MPDPIVMTPEGLAALEAQLQQLETEGRREIAERIRVAREWGDLKENSEYHDAKNSQAHLETKIKRLREQLLAAEVREAPAPTDVVGFGSRVEVDDDAGRRRTYTLVSETEAEPAAGKVSILSPIGKALDGAKPGDTVTVPTPRGRRTLTVVAIGA
jgi:transcription elongation factor GreA